MDIRELALQEYAAALDLAWQVFQEYEAPEYSQQGIRNFYETLQDEVFVQMLKVYGAFLDGRLVGMLAMRSNGEHIALFFVLGKFHRKGIGKALFERACADNTTGRMTVNSSPYALEVYHHLGFVETAQEQLTDGMRYTPMLCQLCEQ